MTTEEFFDTCENFCEPNEDGGFSWSANGAGFGKFSFYFKDEKLMCSNELMDKTLIKKLLCEMVDTSELDNPRE